MPLPSSVLRAGLALIVVSLPLAAQAFAADTARLVVVNAQGALTPADLADLDVLAVEPDGSAATLVAWEQDLLRLRQRGLSYEIVESDLEAFYAARLASPDELAAMAPQSQGPTVVTPAFGQGSMGGYYTFDEVAAILDQLVAQHPTLITPKQSLGLSIEGRDLWAVSISDNPGVDEGEPEVRFDALHHAREPESMQTTLYFMIWLLDNYGSDPLASYLVDEREMWFVPVVNPDGYDFNERNNPNGGGMWRKNRRDNPGTSFDGVDLNRNYPFQWGYDNSGSSGSPSSETYRGTAPSSEPEVQAMVAFLAAHQFGTALSMHTYSDLWLAPWGYISAAPGNKADYDELGQLATEVNGYPYGPAAVLLYPANGVTIDTDQGVHGTMSWTPEIGGFSDGFWPPTSQIVPLAQENLQALQRTALGAGPYLRVSGMQLVDEGDGDGVFEPGETVAVVLSGRNSGVGASTVATASLSSNSPDVTLISASVPLGTWAPFSDIDNAGAPLRFQIDSDIPTGATVTLLAGVGELGFVDTLPISFTVDNDWLPSGPGLAGSAGVPTLVGQGALIAVQPGSLELASAATSAPAWLVLGLGALGAPFKGGVLVPQPDLLLGPLGTDGSGALSLPFVWPHGVVAGTQLWAQFWIQDVAGPLGFAASNGLLGTAR